MCERNISQLPLVCPKTEDWTLNPGMCPYQGLKWQYLALQNNTQPTEPLWSGPIQYHLICPIHVVRQEKITNRKIFSLFKLKGKIHEQILIKIRERYFFWYKFMWKYDLWDDHKSSIYLLWWNLGFRGLIKFHKSLRSGMSLSFLVCIRHCASQPARVLVCNHLYVIIYRENKDTIDIALKELINLLCGRRTHKWYGIIKFLLNM